MNVLPQEAFSHGVQLKIPTFCKFPLLSWWFKHTLFVTEHDKGLAEHKSKKVVLMWIMWLIWQSTSWPSFYTPLLNINRPTCTFKYLLTSQYEVKLIPHYSSLHVFILVYPITVSTLCEFTKTWLIHQKKIDTSFSIGNQMFLIQCSSLLAIAGSQHLLWQHFHPRSLLLFWFTHNNCLTDTFPLKALIIIYSYASKVIPFLKKYIGVIGRVTALIVLRLNPRSVHCCSSHNYSKNERQVLTLKTFITFYTRRSYWWPSG